MFNRKSSYALNKKDPNAIVYMDANEAIIRLTREDFASEEEFLKWKSWSDGNYHTEDNQDVVEGKHNTSLMTCPKPHFPFLPLMWLWIASTRKLNGTERLPRWFLRSGTS